MAVAFDAASSLGFTSSGATATLAHTISGSNTFLVAYVVSGVTTNDYVSGVTWNGTAMVRSSHNVFYNSTNYTHNLWYLRAAEAGSHNIVVTNSTNQHNAIVAMSFTGTAQSRAAQPNRSARSGNGSNATSFTHTSTSTIDDCLLVGGMTPEADRSDMSAASGSTIRAASGTFNRAITADGVLASAGSDTLSATASATGWGAMSLWVAPVEADAAAPSDIEKLNGIAVADIEAVN